MKLSQIQHRQKKREQIWKRLRDKEDKMRNGNIHLIRVPESRTDIFDWLFEYFPNCACQLHWTTRREIHAVTEMDKEKDWLECGVSGITRPLLGAVRED